MKKRIAGCLVTTALALIALAIIADLCGGQFICTETVYQILTVNGLIHIGLWLFEQVECPYTYLEIIGEVSMILLIIFTGGYLCKWFDSMSMLVLAIMSIVVYVAACAVEAIHIHSDLDKINLLLDQMEST